MEKSKYSAGLIGCILSFVFALFCFLVLSLHAQDKKPLAKPNLYVTTHGTWVSDVHQLGVVTEVLKRNFNVIQDDTNYDMVVMSIFEGGGSEISKQAVRLMWVGEPVKTPLKNMDVVIGSEFIDSNNYVRMSIGLSGDATIGRVHKISNPNRKFCCFLYSTHRPWLRRGNNLYMVRNAFFKILSNYKHVDSGGAVLNNIGYKVPPGETMGWLSNYKFVIAFENCEFEGYVTEKLFNAYYAGAIPIWAGSRDALVGINKEAIIYAGDFDSLQDLADYVAKVDQDPELYNKIWNQPLVISEESSYEHLTASLEKKILDALKRKKIIKIENGVIKLAKRSQYEIRKRLAKSTRIPAWRWTFF